ncbi:MAG: RecB-family nuclease [Acidilobaceae archaeon]
MDIIPVLYNVSSTQRLIDMAKLVYGLGLHIFTACKVYGAAAQAGIPEVMRLALKSERGFIVLPDIGDVIDLFKPSIILIVSYAYAEDFIDPFNPPVYSGKVLVVFNGSDPDFSSSELKYGKPIYIKGVQYRLGAIPEATLILYSLLFKLK